MNQHKPASVFLYSNAGGGYKKKVNAKMSLLNFKINPSRLQNGFLLKIAKSLPRDLSSELNYYSP